MTAAWGDWRALCGSADPIVLVVLSLPTTNTQAFRQRCPRCIDLCMDVERGLVGPQFEQGQLVGVEHALEDLELLAAGFLHDLRATVTENAREFRSFARGGVECDDQTD